MWGKLNTSSVVSKQPSLTLDAGRAGQRTEVSFRRKEDAMLRGSLGSSRDEGGRTGGLDETVLMIMVYPSSIRQCE